MLGSHFLQKLESKHGTSDTKQETARHVPHVENHTTTYEVIVPSKKRKMKPFLIGPLDTTICRKNKGARKLTKSIAL